MRPEVHYGMVIRRAMAYEGEARTGKHGTGHIAMKNSLRFICHVITGTKLKKNK